MNSVINKNTHMFQLFNRIANGMLAVVSLVTATGVFMHDGRVDKAAMTALQVSNYSNYSMANAMDGTQTDKWSAFLSTDAHTHPDHNAARSLLHGFSHQSPSIPPREQEQKRHLMQRYEPRGRHAFDNYNLPIVE